MGMWIGILLVTVLMGIGGMVYLISRFYKFSYTAKYSAGKKRRRIALAALPVLILIALTVLTLQTVNMVIILIVLAMVWLICDLLFFCAAELCKLFGHVPVFLEKKEGGPYPAGICAIVLTAVYFLCGWFFAHSVTQTDYSFRSDKISEPLRIALIADAHMGTTFDREGLAANLQKIAAAGPDLLVIAGDLVDDSTSYEEMVACCEELGKLDLPYGVFYAYGNHDKGYAQGGRGYGQPELQAALENNGITVLEDAVYRVNDSCTLIGRADASAGTGPGGYRMGNRAAITDLVEGTPAGTYTVVIDHQPNDYEAEAAAGVDLVLSGHTHGGQLLPVNRVGELIGANDRTYGHERREQTDFVVTSGISAWAIPFKTGCRSEYVIIDLLPAAP